VFIAFMAVEADYTFLSRLTFMSGGT
jgi:cytochrome c oxidase subunit 4